MHSQSDINLRCLAAARIEPHVSLLFHDYLSSPVTFSSFTTLTIHLLPPDLLLLQLDKLLLWGYVVWVGGPPPPSLITALSTSYYVAGYVAI